MTAVDLGLKIKLAQKIIMTPQLQQAIKLLQLSRLELTQIINQQLVENPVLEEDVTEEFTEESVQNKEEPLLTEGIFDKTGEIKLEDMDFGWENYFDEKGSDGRDLGYFSADIEESPSYEQTVSMATTLSEYLLWQLRLSHIDKESIYIGEFIIGNIDDDGYLQASISEISEICRVDVIGVERVLKIIQGFDPPGVGARDLRECLQIQLEQIGLKDTPVEEIIKKYLTDLEKHRYAEIAKRLNISVNDVMAAANVIKGLEPRPGRAYSTVNAGYIVPDVYVYKIGEDYVIMLNDDGLPKLKVNPYYRHLIAERGALLKEEREYLEAKFRTAVWLIKSIEQRNRTIYKVTKNILDRQIEFFEKGGGYLKPMTLKDIASDLGMHESTISRVTNNKYIYTPHGLFEFRYFFSSAIQNSSGGTVSSVTVRNIIKGIVEGEDSRKPVSDHHIVNILKKMGIHVARRTVAKYRAEIDIPPTNIRRKYT